MSRKKENKYDFSGSCNPIKLSDRSVWTPVFFSVGIFQWLPKASGKGLKKSAVVYRVRGLTSDPLPVYDRAKEICDLLDSPDPPEWLEYKKSETISDK